MKIQNDGGQSAGPIGKDKAAVDASRQERLISQKTKPGKPPEDSVEIGGAMKRLEADPARLEELREAIRNGTYQVPAREISARMISEHLDDSTKRS